MSKFFEGEEKELPGPRMIEAPSEKEARSFLLNLLKQGAPLMGVPGMMGYEPEGQEILGKMLEAGLPEGYHLGMGELAKTLTGEYDPFTSPYYQGLREASKREEEEGVGGLRRGSQLGGMFYSEPSQRTEAEYRARMGTGRQSLLGRMYETERGRRYGAIPTALQYGQYAEQQPYRQLGAIQQYGGLPRQIAGAQELAKYQQLMFPYTNQAQLAQMLLAYKPDWYQPQFQQKKSPWDYLMQAGELAASFVPFGGGGKKE